MDNGGLPGLGKPKDDVISICENPYVMVIALDIDACLIHMNEGAFQDALDQQIFCPRVVACRLSHETDDRGLSSPFAKEVFHNLCDEPVG